jgi:hypothetical protein
MPDELLVAATTITVPTSVPAWVVAEDRGSHSVTIATFTGENAKANAGLFAAALDLLAACEALPLDCEFEDAADYKDNASRFDRAMRLARPAIAKAKGGA